MPPVGIRLKAMEMPECSGYIEDWVSFRDWFSSLVVHNSNVSNEKHLQSRQSYDLAGAERASVYSSHAKLSDCWTEFPTVLGQLLDGTNPVLAALWVLSQRVEHWDGWGLSCTPM